VRALAPVSASCWAAREPGPSARGLLSCPASRREGPIRSCWPPRSYAGSGTGLYATPAGPRGGGSWSCGVILGNPSAGASAARLALPPWRLRPGSRLPRGAPSRGFKGGAQRGSAGEPMDPPPGPLPRIAGDWTPHRACVGMKRRVAPPIMVAAAPLHSPQPAPPSGR